MCESPIHIRVVISFRLILGLLYILLSWDELSIIILHISTPNCFRFHIAMFAKRKLACYDLLNKSLTMIINLSKVQVLTNNNN